MCVSCVTVRINGVLCHEHGCPDAWKNTIRECNWCGAEFIPEEKNQFSCSPDCNEAYNF